MIEDDVSVVDQTFSVASDDVSTTEPPSQNVVGPDAEITGVAGGFGSVRVCVTPFETQPLPSVNAMVYEPATNEEIVCGNNTPAFVPEPVPDQVTSPIPDPVISIDPVAELQETGSLTVPIAILGSEFTTTATAAEVAEQPLRSVYVTE